MSNYAKRLEKTHRKAVETFGRNAKDEALYIWHEGAVISCYQTDTTFGKTTLEAAILETADAVFIAGKSEFHKPPAVKDEIRVGTMRGEKSTYRIQNITTGHLRPFYRLECNDPNLAEE